MEGIVHGKGIRIRLSIFDADPDPDPTPSFTHVGKSENFLTFVPSSASLVPVQGPKKSRFSEPTPSNVPRYDVAPLKIITSAIKTTGTLIVIQSYQNICNWPAMLSQSIVQHIAVHLLLLSKKTVSDIPVPSRDVTYQTPPD
jgi:hypothetical protein